MNYWQRSGQKCPFGSGSKCANLSDYCPRGRWFYCLQAMRMKATLSAPPSMMRGRSAGSLKSSCKVLILSSAQWRGSGVSLRRACLFAFSVPPSIEDDVTAVTAVKMSSVALPCHVQGRPQPTVVWTKGGAKLSSRGGTYRVLPTGELDATKQWKWDK